MKKLLLFTLCLVMALSLLTVTSFADEVEETLEQSKIDTISAWIENITSSTSIATLITAILGFGGTGALVATKLKSVLELLKNKADGATIAKALAESTTEITDSFTKELEEFKKNLKVSEEREKMLTAVLGIAFSYSKEIPASARAQIMGLLNGATEVIESESVSKIIDMAKVAIEEAEKTTVKEETPALDAINSITME